MVHGSMIARVINSIFFKQNLSILVHHIFVITQKERSITCQKIIILSIKFMKYHQTNTFGDRNLLSGCPISCGTRDRFINITTSKNIALTEPISSYYFSRR